MRILFVIAHPYFNLSVILRKHAWVVDLVEAVTDQAFPAMFHFKCDPSSPCSAKESTTQTMK